MEKRKPHCALATIKALVQARKVRSTVSALADAAIIGFDFEAMLGVIMALTTADFHKSMTTFGDSWLWQDVYRPSTPFGQIYLKLTVIEDVLIVSFKEL